MKVVVDANILFSALLKEGLTRRIWFHPDVQLCAPTHLIREFMKHRQTLRNRYSGSDEGFEKRVSLLLSHIKLIDDAGLKPYLPAASVLSQDAKDWLYLACALSVDATIWSHDKDFGAQSRVRIVSTEQLAEEFGML